ncbi:MAG: NAD(P)-dependent alcohol dehydrogenase [Bacteroidia bacterium]|nr:NAD(P)-dependent alcohol dehydrogenase [Bacteroidia bacterium]
MKAVICTKYGSPEVLQLCEVDKPIPNDNDILIKINATTVSSADGIMRKSESFVSRVILGFSKPRKKYRIMGLELAGEVESIGKNVKRFKQGDQVFGFTGFNPGTYTEYKCMSEKGSLELKPSNISFEEAASVVDGASTALFFLRNKANIQESQKILIIGASGSIGIFAVQLAKIFGAEVTGICSSSNLKLVKSLGADRVIDYTKEDFATSGKKYDVIFDTAGKSSFKHCKSSLTKNGLYMVTTGAIIKNYIFTFWTKLVNRKRFIFAMSVNKNEALKFIKELIESKKLRTVIDRTFTLEQIVEAHKYLENGNKKGNIVITVTN